VAPPPVPVFHRVGGVSLFLLSLPVAVHCMLAYGVQLGDLRVAVHSLAGCFFYGAFAAALLHLVSSQHGEWRRGLGRQIAKASSSNATASRKVTGSSTANS
jgi:hypothetical protein